MKFILLDSSKNSVHDVFFFAWTEFCKIRETNYIIE
ncbi:hypothetical protein T01_14612 [Trichinella spiralis]|uniref:Uncharacterized protein n=1 Tax=Trichinella spiralis TaxID=6334 RepID=A0A0V1AHJ9_TRISP|nr:hypothetical protein T01_14612 [Trichinella spiralis]